MRSIVESMNANTDRLLTPGEVARWHSEGYVICRKLWNEEEVAACRHFFDKLAESGAPVGMNFQPNTESKTPLKRYPRVMQPHEFHELSMRMMLDKRIESVLTALMDEQPVAAQSMFYYKPPGGKGQALHQDNYYLRVRPKTCVAAWTAIDRSHPENGGLYICPGTQDMEIACPELANPDESFTTHFVRPPDGITPVPVVLDPGDVLFFNGSIVHGSKPNGTATEWRRSFICHYVPLSAEEIAGSYECYHFDGTRRELANARGGGPCGTEFPDGFMPVQWDQAKALGLKPVSSGSIPS